ncbi:MAG: ABC transporter ATP-binding protein [Treponema sp.]|jgi:branched-chain amino acid transport system ATP-binding protein|nr:ABC transporter ATP-binding protein [Treponema sp.]
MLKVEGLSVFYGGIHALRGIDIEVPEGKIITLIGANGAGKSTTLNSIIGVVKPTSGKVLLDGKDITGSDPKNVVAQGLVLVPEGRRIFPNLTVMENLTLGSYQRNDKREVEKDREHCFELFPRLKERYKQLGGTLSGGEQQMLAVARGLMAKPKVLMLDEPSLGLAPIIAKTIFDILRKINSEGTTILLVEQNAKAALEAADYAYVLEVGVISMQNSGDVLLKDDNVRKAYLGEGGVI